MHILEISPITLITSNHSAQLTLVINGSTYNKSFNIKNTVFITFSPKYVFNYFFNKFHNKFHLNNHLYFINYTTRITLLY